MLAKSSPHVAFTSINQNIRISTLKKLELVKS